MKFCTYIKYKYAYKLYTKYCMSDQYKIRKGDTLRLCATNIFDKNTICTYTILQGKVKTETNNSSNSLKHQGHSK